MTDRKEREIRETLKAKALRHIADGQWTYNDLLTIFGMALDAKFREAPTKSQIPGKHLVSRRDRVEHPAGTKFVRKFIRHSGRESTVWRNLYKDLTGKHYGPAGASS